MKILGLILFLLASFASAGGIIGIDFGSENFKVSLIKSGKKFTIVENELSKRFIPSAIAFTDSGRVFGENAIKEQLKKPNSTIVYPKRLFAVPFNNTPTLDYFLSTYQHLDLFEDETRKGVNYRINDFTLYSEEPLVMIFEYIKKISENFAEGSIRDCTITVPSFWARNQRLSMIYAAYAAGLNVLSVINENTAAALYYAIDRNDEKPYHVLFYNLGASYLQVSIAKYFSSKKDNKPIETVEILSHSADGFLGGNLIDGFITESLADEYEKESGVKVRNSEKAMLKLYQQAREAKKTLSKGLTASLVVESLIDGKTLKGTVNREAIDKILEPYQERFIEPVKKALQDAGISIEEIDSFEMIGGASRIPNIQEILKQKLNVELSYNLNPDEAIAHGAAIFAANYTSTMQVKPIRFSDLIPFDVVAKFYSEIDKEFYMEKKIFSKKTALGSMEKLAFIKSEDIRVVLEAHYSNKIVEFTSYHIDVADVTKAVGKEIALLFGFVVDLNGLPFLYESYAQFDGENKKTNSDGQVLYEKKSIKLNQTEIELEIPKVLKLADVNLMISHLEMFKQREKEVTDLIKAKSELESTLYLYKEKLNDHAFINVTTQEEREKFSGLLTKAHEWMENKNYAKENSTEIFHYAHNLHQEISEALERESEYINRKEIIEKAFGEIDKNEEKMITVKVTNLWISEDEFKTCWDMIENTKAWLNEKIKIQKSKNLWEAPAFKVSEVKEKLEKIEKQLEKLINLSLQKPKGIYDFSHTEDSHKKPTKTPKQNEKDYKSDL